MQTAGKHHSAITSIERNPTHSKYFMTVGDWTARIWSEDLKTPIMTTKYHSSYLTAGCWSPTRQGVFFVTRQDGVLDIWDYFYRQNDVALSHKLGDAGGDSHTRRFYLLPLTCSVNANAYTYCLTLFC